MKDNQKLIEYGTEFLKLFKKQFENEISLKPLITFLINSNKSRVEMILDVKIDNGNLEKLKDIEIIQYFSKKIEGNLKVQNLDDLEKLRTTEENESMKEIQDIFRKRHGDYYTASIFKKIEEFRASEVENDFREICESHESENEEENEI